jgi:hypothetical protein
MKQRLVRIGPVQAGKIAAAGYFVFALLALFVAALLVVLGTIFGLGFVGLGWPEVALVAVAPFLWTCRGACCAAAAGVRAARVSMSSSSWAPPSDSRSAMGSSTACSMSRAQLLHRQGPSPGKRIEAPAALLAPGVRETTVDLVGGGDLFCLSFRTPPPGRH